MQKIAKPSSIKKSLLSEDKLICFNEKGLFPAPDESEKKYLDRVIQSIENKQLNIAFLSESFFYLKKKFDIKPNWVSFSFSNKNLLPWHAAITFEIQKNGFAFPIFEMRKSFQSRKKFLRIYDRSEIVAHELVHAARIAFNEPEFEEILAYQTSKRKIRRVLGPVFSNNFFLFSTLIGVLCSSTIDFLFFFDLFFSINFYFFSKVSLLLIILISSIKSVRRLQVFRKCRKKVEKVCRKSSAMPVLLRLTDREIILFSKLKESEIIEYIRCNTTLRWRVIKKCYFARG